MTDGREIDGACSHGGGQMSWLLVRILRSRQLRWCVAFLAASVSGVIVSAGQASAQQSTIAPADQPGSQRFGCVAPAARAAAPQGGLTRLSVAVYDYVGARAEIEFAQRIAAERFARASIGIDWVPCSPTPLGAYVNVLSTEMATRIPLAPGALGFSWYGTRTANVAYGRIARTAVMGRITPAHLLGFVMAHEIAHLLLPSSAHSPKSLMADNFDLELVRMNALEFNRLQARSMRSALMNPAGLFATK
jgi:hypothetical protein